MVSNPVPEVNNRSWPLAGVAGAAALVVLSGIALLAGAREVLVVAWVAFLGMGAGAWLGARTEETDPYRLVWGYGLASGAMIVSAAMFLLPQAMGPGAADAARVGGIGVAAGIVTGYSAHVVGHRLTHVDLGFDVTAVEITIHALSAGAIIGLVYASMPAPGLLLGLAIISHKGPAGYAAARRLRRRGRSPAILLLPASGVGLAGIPTALLPVPATAWVDAAVFGFAAGIFLHVAMDFLPHCDAGSEIDEVCSLSGAHELLDELRVHAVASTALGGLAVVGAWVLV